MVKTAAFDRHGGKPVVATIEVELIDRDGWAPGAWDFEPDRVVWVDPATGLDCMLNRNRLGAWCGYVGVPATHPWHGRGYDDVVVDVHGGLTYAAACNEHICHEPAPGRPGDVWWFGFDCLHFMDRAPGMDAVSRRAGFDDYEIPGTTYRPIVYVWRETTNLAAQLAGLVE